MKPVGTEDTITKDHTEKPINRAPTSGEYLTGFYSNDQADTSHNGSRIFRNGLLDSSKKSSGTGFAYRTVNIGKIQDFLQKIFPSSRDYRLRKY